MSRFFKKLIDSDLFYLTIIALIIFFYFLRLFIPELKVYITPDVALSDQLNLNYSLKYILSKSLKVNRFPWWEPRVANGFPLIGESQIGAFYLPNLILFKLIPFPYSFNLGYIFSFLICAFGSYLFFTRFSKNRLLIFFTSLLFTFSATFFIQIIHYNLLQTYSLIPIIFYCVDNYLSSKKKLLWFVSIILLYTQQFFAGYLMTSFITLFMILLYIFFKMIIIKKRKVSDVFTSVLFFLTLFIVLITLSCSIQIIPMIEFALNSNRSRGLGINSLSTSLSFNALQTYINFYHFGNFNLGVFNKEAFMNLKNGVWDANVYMGLFPLIISLIGMLFLKTKKRRMYVILIAISFFLALGIYSPTYVIYFLPIFNFFRTPSRFTITLNFFLLTIFLITVDIFWKYKLKFFPAVNKYVKKGVLVIASLLTILELIKISYDYHPLQKVSSLSNNSMARFLLQNSPNDLLSNKYKIYQIGNESIWKTTMDQELWKNIDKYIFFQSDLNVFLNALFNIPSASIFYGSFYYPYKEFIYNNYIRKEFIMNLRNEDKFGFKNSENKELKFSNLFIKLLEMKNVRYFITPFYFADTDRIDKIKEFNFNSNNLYFLRLYKLKYSRPRFYIAQQYKKISDPDDFINFLEADTTNLLTVYGKHDLTVTHKLLYGKDINNAELKTEVDLPTFTKLFIKSEKNTLLTNTDAFYPGWNSYVDGKKTDTYNINLNQRGVIIPQGSHTIEFKYEPWWYYSSLVITIVTNIFLIGVWFLNF